VCFITLKNIFYKKIDLDGVNKIELSLMEGNNSASELQTVILKPEEDNFKKILKLCQGNIYDDSVLADGIDESYDWGYIKIAFEGENDYLTLYLYRHTFCTLRIENSSSFINIGKEAASFELSNIIKECGLPEPGLLDFEAVDKIEIEHLKNHNDTEGTDMLRLEAEDTEFQKIINMLKSYDIYWGDDEAKKIDAKENLSCKRITLIRGEKSWSIYLYKDEYYKLRNGKGYEFYDIGKKEESYRIMELLKECGVAELE